MLNCVGKAVFVKYYYDFKTKSNQECIKAISEPYTAKSKATRTSKAKRIFRENMHGEALRIIIESNRIDEAVKKRAKEIMDEDL